MFVNGKEIYKFKADNKNVNIPNQFCLERISEKFAAVKSTEVSFEKTTHDFSVNYNAFDKSDIKLSLVFNE